MLSENIKKDLVFRRSKLGPWDSLKLRFPLHRARGNLTCTQIHRGFELYFAGAGYRPLKCGVSNPTLCNINRAVTFAREAAALLDAVNLWIRRSSSRNRWRRESRIVKIQFSAVSALGRADAKRAHVRDPEEERCSRAWLVGRSATFAAYPAFSTPFFLAYVRRAIPSDILCASTVVPTYTYPSYMRAQTMPYLFVSEMYSVRKLSSSLCVNIWPRDLMDNGI